jgi:flagellar hook-basal body complex protein FliE
MIIPPIGGLTGGLGGALGGAQTESALKAPAAAQAEGLAQGTEPSGAIESTTGGFGSELTNAISSLEKTQQSGNSAAQALATGNVKDPETAVVTVEDAQLAMQLASQIRTKATEAVQSIFQTQV